MAMQPSHSREAAALGPARGMEALLGSAAMQHATFFKEKKKKKRNNWNNVQVFMLKVPQVSSKSCHRRFYQRTVVTNPHFPPWDLQQADNVPQAANPSVAMAQLLGSSIYLLSKLRHGFPFSGPAEVWKLCFTRLMVGKFKFSYSSSAGGGFSCHEAHSSEHAGSARPFQKHIFMAVPYFTSNVSTWVANTV